MEKEIKSLRRFVILLYVGVMVLGIVVAFQGNKIEKLQEKIETVVVE